MIFFIYKGIDSRDVPGLIVQSLPPVTKPPKRYERIEIEGKDGDIIIEKGYSSYDRDIKIGLLPKADIDYIISWLNGKGELILSNEQDKFYNAEILDQIDYTKLLKFKEAKVKFHVQPYKYLYGETSITGTTSGMNVVNQGLESSKPLIKLYGSGTVILSLNGYTKFTYTFPDGDSYVMLDSEVEEAYKDNLNNLKNRNMNGDFPVLLPGLNIFTWTGNITKIEILPRSRWI